MRQKSRKIFIASLIAISLMLTACRTGEPTEDTIKESNITEEAEKSEDAPKPAETDTVDNKARYAAYKDLMLDLCKNNYLPGYEDLSEAVTDVNMSENKFALADIDADGYDELIVYYITTAVAGHTGSIYDYNEETGECYLKLCEYPLLSFYENGALEAGWSHNQGYAGDFWPYTLYVYDKENDTYKVVGFVDAYDRSLYELNKDALENNPFPYDIDVDENGFVYYLYDDGLSDYQLIPAVDDDAYQAWLQEYTQGSRKLEISFYGVTEDNINQVFDLN